MKIIIISLLFFALFPGSRAWSQSCFTSNSSCSKITAPSKCVAAISIPSQTRLCPRDTRKGDREFSGHGPKVTAKAWLSLHNKNRLALNLYLHAIETKKDFTEAKGNWHQTLCNVPTGYKITRILNRAKSDASYTDSNHKLDVPKVINGTLVRKFEINGDTKGKDIGNCTTGDVYMNVFFNSPQIEIQRLEKIISRLDILRNYPFKQVNKLSQSARSISHDDNFWYIAQQKAIWKIPVSFDLISIGTLAPSSAIEVGIPPLLKRKGYSRYGDIDQYKGRLYVVLEGDGRVSNRPLIVVFNNSDMNLINIIPLQQSESSIAFIAINPIDGTLYSSVVGQTYSLKRYRISINGEKVILTPLSPYTLLDRNGRNLSSVSLKSGSFSDNGRYLFLLSGNSGRLLSFNLRTHKLMQTLSLPGGIIPQAVSYWNVGNKAPGAGGQLHLLNIHPNPNERDAYSLEHYLIREIYDINTS